MKLRLSFIAGCLVLAAAWWLCIPGDRVIIEESAASAAIPFSSAPSSAPAGPLSPKRSPPRLVLLEDSPGKPSFLSQPDAEKACAKRGQRLPTIRELARAAQATGAKGVLELGEVRTDDKILEYNDQSPGYRLIRAIDAGAKEDRFYYNAAGFAESFQGKLWENSRAGEQRADGTFEGDIGYYPGGQEHEGRDKLILQYWSSSRGTCATPEEQCAWVADIYGRIHDHYVSLHSLVRCVAGE